MNMLQFILTSIEKASVKLKRSKYRKGLKPYWSDALTKLSKYKYELWNQWKYDGSNKNDDLYRKYKDCKRQFKYELKIAKEAYEQEQMNDISRSSEIDQTYLWKIINKGKKGVHTVQPIQVDNEIITDTDTILQKWKDYFF